MSSTIPAPKPGLIFRYDYLWSDKAAAGRDQDKERPACLVVASDPLANIGNGLRFVVILPITHSPPRAGTVAIEIPAKVKRAIGLDKARSWIVVSDYNVDQWPNAGLAPIPGRRGVFSYGFIPPGLFQQVKDAFLTARNAKRTRGAKR